VAVLTGQAEMFSGPLDSEGDGATRLRNVGNNLPVDTASRATRCESCNQSCSWFFSVLQGRY
jgi:hypothetical protein